MKFVLVLALLLMGQTAAATCRLALALGMDVSGSVDEREYRLQFEGLAAALGDQDVRQVFFAMPEAPVALAVYEWSASSYQRVILDWVLVDSPARLNQIRQRILALERLAAPAETGLGQAMLFGHQLLMGGPRCWDKTLDISGDGRNNDWPPPEYLRQDARLAGTRINGLVVQGGGADLMGELTAYFHARVIQGPDAFLEVALGYDDYEAAIKRKLLREMAVKPLAQIQTKTDQEKSQRF